MIITLYKKFQSWSEKGSIFILSDLHFDDSDCKLMDPNWISIEEQQNILRNTIHKNDTFICLGDIGNKQCLKEIWPLNKKPYIVLILGNHDAPGEFNNDNYFDEVYNGPLFISNKLLLSHEPIMVSSKEGLETNNSIVYNIHGHNHSGDMYEQNGINLACNVCEYKPISLKTIINSGVLKQIDDIHRITIDRATENKFI